MKGTRDHIASATYKLATDGYLYELTMLVKLIQSHYFQDLISGFADYGQFLEYGKTAFLGDDILERVCNSKREIHGTDRSDAAQKLFACANLAACCEVFNGWTIPAGELQLSRTKEYLQLALSHAKGDKNEVGRNLAVRLNKGDAARVIQSLKLLGLLRADTGSYHQLSLGSSVGERDRHALHQTPFIRQASTSAAASTKYPPLVFGSRTTEPKHVVMIDNDPILDNVYRQFNSEANSRTLALNLDIHEGLAALAARISDNEVQQRDLVVGFRLEPSGYPDIPMFFRQMKKVITPTADFVVTIGAGDELPDFKSRLDLMDNIATHLSQRGMYPVRIKHYQGQGPKQQHQNPVFGLSQYASYEVIYCRIERAQL